MVVVFFLPPYTTKNYQVLCQSKENGVKLIQHWYPMAVKAIWLPHNMDSIVQMIKQKRVAKKPFLHNLIFRTIGELAESEGCAALADKFRDGSI